MINLSQENLPGNSPILLKNLEEVKIIKSGSLGIFLTKIDQEKPVGKRYYLFSLKAGDAIFSMPPWFDGNLDSRIGLVGFTIEKTCLETIAIETVIAQIIDHDQEAIKWLSKWLHSFGENLRDNYSISEIYQTESSQQLRQNLINFYDFLEDNLNTYLEEYSLIKKQRFQARQELNYQLNSRALEDLTSVFGDKQEQFIPKTNLLLGAAGAVAKAQGIKLNFPSFAQDQEITVEDLATVSRIRIRRVILSGEWWLQDHGCLLGFLQENNRPVALILDKSKNYSYFLYDPQHQTKLPISPLIAETISVVAYTFYRPLPSWLSGGKEVLKFALKEYNYEIIRLFIIGFFGSFLGLAIPQATAILINQAIPDSNNFLLLQIGLGLLVITFGKTILNLSQGLISLRIINGAVSWLQPTIWDRLLQLSPAFIRRFSRGDLLARIMVINQIYLTLSGSTQRIILNSIFALINLVLMLFYSFKLTLISLLISLIAVIFTWFCSSFLIKQERKKENLLGQIQGLTIQLINGVAKLKVAAAEERAFATWAKQYSQYNRIDQNIIIIKNLQIIGNNLLLLSGYICLYWFGFLYLKQPSSNLNLGGFLAFNTAFVTFFQGLIFGSEILSELLNLIPLWERLKPVLQETIESDANKVIPSELSGQVMISHVNFRYRPDAPLILDDISLHANPGEFIAIVGPSGSGKSTLLRLLLGFENPVSGVIYYDGQDLAILDLPALRRQLGVVLQNGQVIQGSIFQNITSGTNRSMDEAWEAAQIAKFAEEIEAMPMGMHTVVNEGGENLSGGQKQRLMIARSLVFHPKIILFDEATSALDNYTQAMITESLEQLKVTRIAIAHRLSTVRNADRIYVMEAGHIVQVGTFEELANQPGLFARLIARQL